MKKRKDEPITGLLSSMSINCNSAGLCEAGSTRDAAWTGELRAESGLEADEEGELNMAVWVEFARCGECVPSTAQGAGLNTHTGPASVMGVANLTGRLSQAGEKFAPPSRSEGDLMPGPTALPAAI